MEITQPDTRPVTSLGSGGSGNWTIFPLVLGLAAIAACVIVPQADINRRMNYERQRLQADLDQINRQTAMNEAFLGKLDSDPQLAQRLAQRQMKFIRQGESLLTYKSPQNGRSVAANRIAGTVAEMSPFSLVRIPPPAAMPAYQPAGGFVRQALLDSHVRLYCLAGGLFLAAMGLILGSNEPNSRAGA